MRDFIVGALRGGAKKWRSLLVMPLFHCCVEVGYALITGSGKADHEPMMNRFAVVAAKAGQDSCLVRHAGARRARVNIKVAADRLASLLHSLASKSSRKRQANHEQGVMTLSGPCAAADQMAGIAIGRSSMLISARAVLGK